LNQALAAVSNRVKDLQTIHDFLWYLLIELQPPSHHQLKWRPVVVSITNGVKSYGILVENAQAEDVLAPGIIRPDARGKYAVIQVEFVCCEVDSLEEGYDILLQRVWSSQIIDESPA